MTSDAALAKADAEIRRLLDCLTAERSLGRYRAGDRGRPRCAAGAHARRPQRATRGCRDSWFRARSRVRPIASWSALSRSNGGSAFVYAKTDEAAVHGAARARGRSDPNARVPGRERGSRCSLSVPTPRPGSVSRRNPASASATRSCRRCCNRERAAESGGTFRGSPVQRSGLRGLGSRGPAGRPDSANAPDRCGSDDRAPAGARPRRCRRAAADRNPLGPRNETQRRRHPRKRRRADARSGDTGNGTKADGGRRKGHDRAQPARATALRSPAGAGGEADCPVRLRACAICCCCCPT